MKIDTLYQPKLSASGKVTVAVCFAFLGNAAVAANIEAIGQNFGTAAKQCRHRQHCRTDGPRSFSQPI